MNFTTFRSTCFNITLIIPLFALFVLLSMPAAFADEVQSTQMLTFCKAISVPGTYALANDVSAQGTCFIITADDVIFDGNGHTIDYAQSSVGDGIRVVSADDVVIRNTKFSSSYANNPSAGGVVSGVQLVSANRGVVSDNVFEISGDYNRGVYVSNSSQVLIDENSFDIDAFGSVGIELRKCLICSTQEADELSLFQNTVSDNIVKVEGFSSGILVLSSSQTLIDSNNVEGGSGIYISRSHASTVKNNVIDSSLVSFDAFRTTDVTLKNNKLSSSWATTTNLNQGVVRLTFVSDALIEGNDIFSVGPLTPAISFSAANNTITKANFISSEKNTSILLQGRPASETSTNNVFSNNELVGREDLKINNDVLITLLRDQEVSKHSVVSNARLVVENSLYGKTAFSALTTFDGDDLYGLSQSSVFFSDNLLRINQNLPVSNVEVALYGIGNRGFTNPKILRNGVECTTCVASTSLTAQTVKFSAPGAGEYRIGEGNAVDVPVSISFSALPNSGVELLQSTLRCDVTSGNGPMQVIILSGDGASSTTTITGPDTILIPKSYDAGNYVASCTVTDIDGDTQTKTASVSVSKAVCNDGLDNDGDGLVDLADSGCSDKYDSSEFNDLIPVATLTVTPTSGTSPLTTSISCSSVGGDGLVSRQLNFGDGTSTSQNTNIQTTHVYTLGTYTVTCAAIDADGDVSSKTQIVTVSSTPACSDGLDNDNDGLVDLADPGCSSPSDGDEGDGTSQCQDGLDNDNDGLVDLADPGCSSPQDNDESDGTSACQDGIDNDGDGATDYPADASCSSPQDNDELFPIPACQNGIDDDGDGLVDLADPGCSGKQDTSELNDFGVSVDLSANTNNAVAPATIVLICSVDASDVPVTVKFDFGDGTSTTQTIFASTSISKTHVYATSGTYLASCNARDADGDSDLDSLILSISTPACSDGLDNDNDGLVDLADPGCSSPSDGDEGDGTSQCQDGLDNDNDGLIDLADPACSSPQDDDESDDPSISFGGLPPANAKVGRLYYFDLNPIAANPTFTKVMGPAGLNVDATGVITWIPQKGDVGAHRVIIRISSGSLYTDVVWTIQVSDDGPEREELQFSQIRFLGGEITQAGRELGVSVALNNDGQDIDNMEVSFTVYDLGVRRTVGPFDFTGESASQLVYLDIPSYALPGEYLLKVTVSADGEVLRNTHRYFTVK